MYKRRNVSDSEFVIQIAIAIGVFLILSLFFVGAASASKYDNGYEGIVRGHVVVRTIYDSSSGDANKSSKQDIVIEYKVDGKKYRKEMKLDERYQKLGKTVWLEYNESKPRQVKLIKDTSSIKKASPFEFPSIDMKSVIPAFAGMSVALVGVTVVLFMFAKSRKPSVASEEVVHVNKDNSSYEKAKGLIETIEDGKLIISFGVDGKKYSIEKKVISTKNYQVGNLVSVEYDRLDPSICRTSSTQRKKTVRVTGSVEMADNKNAVVVYESWGKKYKKLYVNEAYPRFVFGEVVSIELEIENPDFTKILKYSPKVNKNAEYVTKALEEKYKKEHNIQGKIEHEMDYGNDYNFDKNDYKEVNLDYNQAAEDAYYNDESRWGEGFASEDYEEQYKSTYEDKNKYGMNSKDGNKIRDLIAAVAIVCLICAGVVYCVFKYIPIF